MHEAQTLISKVDELSHSLPRTVSKSEMEDLLWAIKNMVEMNPRDLLSDLVATGIVGKPREQLRADSVNDIRYGLVRLFTDLALKCSGR